MKALVLEEKGKLNLRDFPVPLNVGPNDVRIATHTVGVCGSAGSTSRAYPIGALTRCWEGGSLLPGVWRSHTSITSPSVRGFGR